MLEDENVVTSSPSKKTAKQTTTQTAKPKKKRSERNETIQNTRNGSAKKKARSTRKDKAARQQEDEDSVGLYKVEKIIRHRIMPTGREYLVKWEDFPNSDNTWEPEDHMLNNEVFDQYLKKNFPDLWATQFSEAAEGGATVVLLESESQSLPSRSPLQC